MCKYFVVAALAVCFMASALAEECSAFGADFKIPVKLKTRGKPKVARWEKVDEVMNGLGEKVTSSECSFTFEELFRYKKEDELYFPLTNTVLRVVPEESLPGTRVFNKDGEQLGVYANRFSYERSGGLQLKKSYSVYFFQYKNAAEKLQAVRRTGLLLDDFVVKWSDIKDKVAVSGK